MAPPPSSNKRKPTDTKPRSDAVQPLVPPPVAPSSHLHETEYLKMLEVKKSAFLGYGIMSFADLNDMGRGLPLELKRFNPRVATAAQISLLRAAVSGDPKDPTQDLASLARFSPDHAMSMLIKRRYIEVDCLRRDSFSSEFLQVRWTIDARDPNTKDVTHLVNGNTRRELCLSLGADAISKLDGIKSKIIASKGSGPEYHKLLTERTEAITEVRLKTSWIVAFYDQEYIEANMFSTEVIFELSKNKPAYQVPDSEAASLQLTINSILSVPKAEQLDKIRKASSTNSYMLQGMPKRLQAVFKDASLFAALVKLNTYSVLWTPRVPTTHAAFSWRPAGAPFMEAIILQGVLVLDFLTSSKALPRGGLSIAEAQAQLLKEVPVPVPNVLNTAFFEMVNKVYKTHLYEIREFFGLSKSSRRDREKWANAMNAYWADLVKEVRKWSDDRKAEIKHLRMDTISRSQIETALDRMIINLPWVAKGLFNSTHFGMQFPTPAPLLCPSSLVDVSDSVIALKSYLNLAWRWVDAFAMNAQAIEYSSGTTFSLIHIVDRINPKIPSQQVVWAICSEIFNMRTDVLVALCNAEKNSKVGPLPPKFSLLPTIDTSKPADLVETLVAALKAWRNNSSNDIIKSRGLRRRDMPADGQFNTLNLPSGAIVINALGGTYYPWADCPGSQVANRLKSAARFGIQSIWLSNHQEDTYGNIPGYWVLRAAIEKILLDQTAFKGWWDCIECPDEDEPEMPPSSQGPDAISTRGHLSGKFKANEILSGTQKTIQTIIKILCTEEAGAIPVSINKNKTEYGPFEDVHAAAMALFEALAVASFRAQSIYTHPNQDRLAMISKAKKIDCLSRFDFPSSFKPAAFEDVKTYYAPFDTDQLNNLEVFGPGSLAGQKGKTITKKKIVKLVNKEVLTTSASEAVGTVLVEGTPDQPKVDVPMPKTPAKNTEIVIDFSSPPVEDDLLFKVNIIQNMELGDDYKELEDEEEEN